MIDKQGNQKKMMPKILAFFYIILISTFFVSCQLQAASDQEVTMTKTSTSFLAGETQAFSEMTVAASPSVSETPEPTLIPASSLTKGSYIVYSTMEGVSDIGYEIISLFLMDIQGTDHGIFAHNVFEADISSDGKYLVHPRYSEDYLKTELIITNMDSGEEFVLPNGTDCANPSFSPDRNWVVSSCIDRNIYAISIPEGDKVLLTDCDALGGSCTHPLWAPNKAFIAINYLKEFHPGWGWYLLDPKCIQDTLGCDGNWKFAWAGTGIGDWSDDGRYFVFDKGDWTLSIIDLENNMEHQVEIPTKYQTRSLAWSPDNKYIAISGVRTDPSRYVIDLLEVETGELIQISHGDYKNVEFWISVSGSSE